MPNAFLMALVAGGRLVELQIVRRDRPTRVESVFLGRLERVMPELDAAFVDIGIGRSGFLRAEDRAGNDDWPPPGAPLLVQVRNDAEGEKGPRVSMNVAVTGRYLVYHPVGSGVSFSRRIEGESERERLRGHVEGLAGRRHRAAHRRRRRRPDVLRARCHADHGALGADPRARRSPHSRRPTCRRAFPASAIRSPARCAITAPRSKR